MWERISFKLSERDLSTFQFNKMNGLHELSDSFPRLGRPYSASKERVARSRHATSRSGHAAASGPGLQVQVLLAELKAPISIEPRSEAGSAA